MIEIGRLKLKTLWLILRGIGERSHGYAIYAKTQISLKHIYTILPQLVKAGLVREVGYDPKERRKYYSLTEKGKTLLDILTLIMGESFTCVVFDLENVIFEKILEDPSEDRISVSTWDLLFIRMGIYDEYTRLKKDRLNYNEMIFKACEILKKRRLNEDRFYQMINSRNYTPGVKEVIETLLEKGVKIGIIGGFRELAQKLIKEFHLENEIKQNKIILQPYCALEFAKDGTLIKPILERTDYENKASLLEAFTKVSGISPKEIAYIGSDVEDIPIMKRVGLAIAFNTNKPSVINAAKWTINEKDLRKVLPHLYKD